MAEQRNTQRKTLRKTERKTERKPQRGKRPVWLRVTLWSAIAGVGLGLAFVLAVVGMFAYYGRDPALPQVTGAHDYKPKTVTRIFDRHDVLIGELAMERRTVVPMQRIPEVLVNAVVAAEDAEFFQHRGLDYMGMLRAFFVNLRAGRFVQGGSTITQQVIKTFFLTPERTIRRKMQEVILARRLESELGKKQILHLYLNQIYFGHGCYGVQEASRHFFGKDVSRITVGEAALLAGLPQSPERLSPLKHPERAKRRQAYVLGEMVRRGYISEEVRRGVAGRPIRLVRSVRPFLRAAPEVTDLVRGFLAQAFGEQRLLTLGVTVQTAVDVKLQVAAKEALQWGLRAIDARHGYRRPLRRLQGVRLERMLRRLQREQRAIREGNHYLAVVTAVDDAAEQLTADIGGRKVEVFVDDERYNPERHAPSLRFAPGDLIGVRAIDDKTFRFDQGPQGALVAVDPASGEVLAMVGGYDHAPGAFNRATQAERQPGSAFKPLLYAAALDSGAYTAATVIDDAPLKIGSWEPKNYDGEYRGPIRLREALTHSVNTVAARLIQGLGVEPVRALAARLGIGTELGRDLSIALGTSGVRVLDLAMAYATIASGGRRFEPRVIRRIGSEAVNASSSSDALRPEVAYLITSMLESAVQLGTGRAARQLRRPAAGKTGTTNEQKDAWFAGFVPQLVAVVWVGFDMPRTLGRGETGSRAALPIWVRFMRRALQGKPKQSFARPANITVQSIDPRTGLLAREGALEAIEELFISGTEPKELAPETGDAAGGLVPAAPGGLVPAAPPPVAPSTGVPPVGPQPRPIGVPGSSIPMAPTVR